MNFKLDNYNKPSNKKWKLVGDICLTAIPVYIPIILALPINEEIKLLVNSLCAFILATIKIISNFTSELDEVETTTEVNTKAA